MPVQHIGSQIVRIDGDVISIQWIGDMSAEDVIELCACTEAMFESHAMIFVVFDARAAGGIGREARRHGSDWSHTARVAGLAMVGAGLAARTGITIIRAVVKTFGRMPLIPMRFVDTEEQARAWIDTRRRELHGGET